MRKISTVAIHEKVKWDTILYTYYKASLFHAPLQGPHLLSTNLHVSSLSRGAKTQFHT